MLEIQNLKAGYAGKVIVNVPTLSLKPGEHCLILGKSGSGKTTLLYAIAGLLKPISGRIALDGTELVGLRNASLDHFRGKNIGIIYQALHMVSALSVLENLELVNYSAGLAQDVPRAERLLSQLGLFEHRHRKPETLSQGQQQRVAIARAAMGSPKIILGDEPTSALDDEACETVMKLLLEAARESQASLIIATHDARIRKYFQKTVALGDAQ